MEQPLSSHDKPTLFDLVNFPPKQPNPTASLGLDITTRKISALERDSMWQSQTFILNTALTDSEYSENPKLV